jgi:transposase
MAARECPMCGEMMRLQEREITDRIPGSPQTHVAKFREWVCPECDYFEDADESD